MTLKSNASNTIYSLLELLVAPIGLQNSSATFQTLVNLIFFQFIRDVSVIYLDDILITARAELIIYVILRWLCIF